MQRTNRDFVVMAVSTVTACRMLDICKTTLFKLLNEHRLESIKIGRSRRILVASIERLLAKTESTPRDPRQARKVSKEEASSRAEQSPPVDSLSEKVWANPTAAE